MSLVYSTTALSQWEQSAKLLPGDGEAFDEFGVAVAIGSGRVLVGASGDDDTGANAGAAYLFDAVDLSLISKLNEPPTGVLNRYGTAVALGPSVALVGAWGDSGPVAESGAVYVYDISSGARRSKVTAADAQSDDRFGFALDIDGAMALIGAYIADGVQAAAGAAYLIDLSSPDAPVQRGRLQAGDGVLGDNFGWSVAIDGDLALVGAPLHDGPLSTAGAAYLFDITDPQRPVELAKLTADDAQSFEKFGWSVALSGTVAVVGAPERDRPGVGADVGAAYLYDITDPTRPVLVAVLEDPGGAALDEFANAVATNGGDVLVSSWRDDLAGAGVNTGAVFLFDAASGEQLGVLRAADPAPLAEFGVSIGVSGQEAIVGAWSDDDLGFRSGAAYLFDAASCEADLDDDGELTIFDFLAFQNLFDAGDPAADFDGDGELTLFDFLAFQNAFDAGCP